MRAYPPDAGAPVVPITDPTPGEKIAGTLRRVQRRRPDQHYGFALEAGFIDGSAAWLIHTSTETAPLTEALLASLGQVPILLYGRTEGRIAPLSAEARPSTFASMLDVTATLRGSSVYLLDRLPLRMHLTPDDWPGLVIATAARRPDGWPL